MRKLKTWKRVNDQKAHFEELKVLDKDEDWIERNVTFDDIPSYAKKEFEEGEREYNKTLEKTGMRQFTGE
jgi:hypothetical protein